MRSRPAVVVEVPVAASLVDAGKEAPKQPSESPAGAVSEAAVAEPAAEAARGENAVPKGRKAAQKMD